MTLEESWQSFVSVTCRTLFSDQAFSVSVALYLTYLFQHITGSPALSFALNKCYRFSRQSSFYALLFLSALFLAPSTPALPHRHLCGYISQISIKYGYSFFPVLVCLGFWVSIVVVQSVSVCRLLLVLLLFCSCRSFYVYKWTNFDVLLCASLSLSVCAPLPLPLLCWKVIPLLLSFCRVCFWNM